MVNGTLYKFLEGSGSEEVYYELDMPSLSIGGTNNPVSYSTSFAMPFEHSDITNALLEVAAIVKEPSSVRWKISFNEVVVTREFKPLMCINFRGFHYCKLVYNVKPIIVSKPSKDLKTTVRHLAGTEVSLQSIGILLTAYNSLARSSYTYLSGFLEVKPGEMYEVEIPSTISAEEVNIRIVAEHPSSKAKLYVEGGGSKFELEGFGIQEHAVTLSGLAASGEGRALRIRAANDNIILSSILLYNSAIPKPRLEARIEAVSGEQVRVHISNVGSANAEKVVVNCISLGVIVDRKILDSVRAGESIELSMRCRPGSTNTIRIVWRYRGETNFKDLKLKM